MSHSVFISNLYPDVDASKLCEEFGRFGRILSAEISFDRNNLISLCKGCICYDNPSSALMATEMNGKINGLGKSLKITTKEAGDCAVKTKKFTKIFVKNIDLGWDNCDLHKFFQKFGEVDDAHVSETNGKSNGYGFVQFINHSAANAAVTALQNTKLNDKQLIIQPYVEKSKREIVNLDKAKEFLEKNTQYNNLHVKNLPKNTSETELEALFSPFGTIASVNIPLNEAGQMSGYGFVCFDKEEDAKTALKRMNHYNYKSKVIEVNYFQKKAARQHYLKLINSDSEVRRFDQEMELPSSDSRSRRFDKGIKTRHSQSLSRNHFKNSPESSYYSLLNFSAKGRF